MIMLALAVSLTGGRDPINPTAGQAYRKSGAIIVTMKKILSLPFILSVPPAAALPV